MRVRCGAVVPRPLVTSPFHLFPLPRLVFLLRACPPLLVPCALLLSFSPSLPSCDCEQAVSWPGIGQCRFSDPTCAALSY